MKEIDWKIFLKRIQAKGESMFLEHLKLNPKEKISYHQWEHRTICDLISLLQDEAYEEGHKDGVKDAK